MCYIIAHTDANNGIALKNEFSHRSLNVQHGHTAEGSTIDTYPYVIDNTFTQRWKFVKAAPSSDYSGYQLKNLIKPSMGLDVATNGTGKPFEAASLRLYTPTSDNCSFWEIRCRINEDHSISVQFSSEKAPDLFMGYSANDLNTNGKARENFILKKDRGSDTWFVVLNPDGKPMMYNPDDVDDVVSSPSSPSSVVKKRLMELQNYWNGKYFTVSRKPCTKHDYNGICKNCKLSNVLKSLGYVTSGYSDSYTCAAFQRFIYWQLFGEHDRSYNCSVVEKPMVGDVVDFMKYNKEKKKYEVSHYAIFVDQTPSGDYIVLDSNYSGVCQVATHVIDNKKYARVRFWHANNYDAQVN